MRPAIRALAVAAVAALSACRSGTVQLEGTAGGEARDSLLYVSSAPEDLVTATVVAVDGGTVGLFADSVALASGRHGLIVRLKGAGLQGSKTTEWVAESGRAYRPSAQLVGGMETFRLDVKDAGPVPPPER